MRRLLAIIAAAMLVTATAPFSARAQDDDILKYLINTPSVDAWQLLGVKKAPKPQRAQVLGDRAIRIEARQNAQPWNIAAQMQVTGAIKQGDTILLAVWARLATPAQGAQTSRLPLRVQQSSAPYAALAEDAGEIGPEWKMVYASGVAKQDYAVGAVNLSVHLATANHTVELGPALLLNFGQNYDAAKLPRNTP
jgi:hypothetical protein